MKELTSTARDLSALPSELAGDIRNTSTATMRILLTQVEAILGDTAQGEAFKKLIKHEFYRMMDTNQHWLYIYSGFEKKDIVLPLEPSDEITMPEVEHN